MTYQVVYDKKAIKSLSKIDRGQQNIILAWVEKNLVNTDNPKKYGKVLKGSLNEYWRYRVGNYRILADINENEIKIIIFNLGHKKIYIQRTKKLY